MGDESYFAYYVLDVPRDDNSVLRILAVTPTGISSEIVRFPRQDAYTNFSLSSGYGRGLMVAEWSSSAHAFLQLDLAGNQIASVSSSTGTGGLSGAPFVEENGIAWQESTPTGDVVHGVSSADLHTDYAACATGDIEATKFYSKPAMYDDGRRAFASPVALAIPSVLGVTAGSADHGEVVLVLETSLNHRRAWHDGWWRQCDPTNRRWCSDCQPHSDVGTIVCSYRSRHSHDGTSADSDYQLAFCTNGKHGGSIVNVSSLTMHVEDGAAHSDAGRTTVSWALQQAPSHAGATVSFGNQSSACF